MANQDPKRRPENDNNNNNRTKFSIAWLLIVVAIVTILGNQFVNLIRSARQEEVTYDTFLTQLEDDEIAEVQFETDRIDFTLRKDADSRIKTVYYTGILPNVELTSVVEQLKANGVQFTGEIVEPSSMLFSWLLFPLLLLFGFFLIGRIMMARGGADGGFGAIGNIGKSKAKVYMEKETGVTFKDVAGQDEAKESLEEIIDFLHNPQKYAAIGAKLPKGALLVGSPGTGKTLLAKAVAGEAHVPFFSISGSDFVEMFVGVGASRVRDLFKEASKVAPAIIFID